MNLPELYSANNECACEVASYIFRKYDHLINVKKEQSILEIGGGEGKTTATIILPFLQNSCKEFVLTDKSEIMLAHAKKMPELSNREIVKLDIEDANIPKGFKNRFDLVISNLALQWVTDVRQAVQNIYDMLKPGGRTFCVFFSKSPFDYVYGSLLTDPKWAEYSYWFYKHCHASKIFEVFQESLNKAGFKNHFMKPVEYVYKFSNQQEVEGLYTSCNCNMRKIPKELLAEYMDDSLKYFKKDKMWSFKKSEDGQDLITVKYELVVLYAEKPSEHQL